MKIVKTTGSVARVWGVFTNPDSVAPPLAVSGRTLIDPTTLHLKTKTPTGDVAEYDYPDDDFIVRQSVGVYYFLLGLEEEGTYHWEWNASSGTRRRVVLGELDSVHETEF